MRLTGDYDREITDTRGPLGAPLFLHQLDALSMLCLATEKWGLYISRLDGVTWEKDPKKWIDELPQALPFWKEVPAQCLVDGSCVVLFDTEDEMINYYDRVVGDDGPTRLNDYSGPVRLYALTCGPDGARLDENT